jgi:hypothetical protein
MKRRTLFSCVFVVCMGAALWACGSDPSQGGTIAESATAELTIFPPICFLPDTPCGGLCVNEQNDPKNCGACGRSCGASACAGGQCCPPGWVSCGNTCTQAPADPYKLCDGRCLDTSDDPKNCGACGRSCGTGACIDGQCCDTGWAACGGKCTAVFYDRYNCGSCGNVCPNGQCASGSCCPEGFMACQGDLCMNVAVDYANCGACGHICGLGQSCKNGVCVCPPNAHFCG